MKEITVINSGETTIVEVKFKNGERGVRELKKGETVHVNEKYIQLTKKREKDQL